MGACLNVEIQTKSKAGGILPSASSRRVWSSRGATASDCPLRPRLAAPLGPAAAVSGESERHLSNKAMVLKPRQKARVHLVVALGRGNHRWEGGVVAVVEQLVELLPNPGRCRLRAKIVKDQKLSRPYLLKELIISNLTLRAESCPEVV